MRFQRVQAVALLSALALMASGRASAAALDDEDAWGWELPATGSEELPEAAGMRPIVDELADGIVLIETQIANTEQSLRTAQTDRERQLIREHLQYLQDERQTLNKLLNQLVGPHFDARAAAKEQQAEHETERTEKLLEQRRTAP